MTCFLIAILRPTDQQLRKRKPSTLLKLRVWLYTSLVSWLAAYYNRCAVHDILLMPGGLRVEVEERDMDFEHEMELARIGTKHPWRKVPFSPDLTLAEPRRPRWLAHYFKWQRSVRVVDPNDRTMVIDHTRQTVVRGNMNVRAEVANDGRVRLSLVGHRSLSHCQTARVDGNPSVTDVPRAAATTRRRRVPPPSTIPETIVSTKSTTGQSADQPAQSSTPRQGRVRRTPIPVDVESIPATVIPPETAAQQPTEPLPKPQPPLKKMHGFDMDDSF